MDEVKQDVDASHATKFFSSTSCQDVEIDEFMQDVDEINRAAWLASIKSIKKTLENAIGKNYMKTPSSNLKRNIMQRRKPVLPLHP